MSDILKFKKGEIIFREGSTGKAMYDVSSGLVGIYSNYGTADEKLLVKLGKEKYFGEMALVSDEIRSATAVALEDTELYEITAYEFATFLIERPGKFFEIMQSASERLRELSSDYLKAQMAIKEFVADQEEGREHSKELISTMKEIATVAGK